jgi:hypothetical protein
MLAAFEAKIEEANLSDDMLSTNEPDGTIPGAFNHHSARCVRLREPRSARKMRLREPRECGLECSFTQDTVGQFRELVCLFADAERADQRAIAADVTRAKIVEQATALTHEHQQAATRVEVLRVNLEVLRQLPDPLGQQRDLHFRRASVAVASFKLLDDFRLDLLGERHGHL